MRGEVISMKHRFENGWQQTNSEISHRDMCDVFRSDANRCTCGAFEATQALQHILQEDASLLNKLAELEKESS